jgi:hypothetical protein
LGTAIERGFGIHVERTLEAYAAAFHETPVFLNCAPGGNARRPWALAARKLGIGVKHSGLQPDQDSHQGYGSFTGSWDMVAEAGSVGQPVAIESAHWLSKENIYWSFPAALHYRPQFLDLHSDWFTAAEPSWLSWAARHVGVTMEDTPSVWAVLRDAEYPRQMWSATTGVSGKEGDWCFGLRRASAAAAVLRADIPVAKEDMRSRQCRRIDSACLFEVDLTYASRFPAFQVSITLLDTGVGYSCYGGDGDEQSGTVVAAHEGTKTWVTHTLSKPISLGRGGNFFIKGSNLHVHKVELVGVSQLEPEPEPEPATLEQRVADVEARMAQAVERITALEEVVR